jgi:hypothetical protein
VNTIARQQAAFRVSNRPATRRRASRGRSARRWVAALVTLSLAPATGFGLQTTEPAYAGSTNPAYSAQPGRGADWLGLPDGLPPATVQAIATNDSYVVLNKIDYLNNIQKQLLDVNNLVAAAAAKGRQLNVFAYYPNNVWLTKAYNGMLPYSALFPLDASWFLTDYQGNTIPYYRETDPTHLLQPVGFVTDTTDVAYQQWLVSTVTAWLQLAPFKGIAFDGTNIRVGTSPVGALVGTNPNLTWNELLCGPGTYTGNCGRVDAMNAGLTTIVANTATAIHPLGQEVLYNGIARSPGRDDFRNTGLLDYADVASNESFCYGVDPDGAVQLRSLTDDWAIMKAQAAQGKKIIEMINYADPVNNLLYGDYCTAGFLLGWQPGSDYLVVHKDSSSELTLARNPVAPFTPSPAIPQIRLNLGNPSGDLQQTGAVYFRSFHNGLVALNPSSVLSAVRLPATMTQFSNGVVHASFPANTLFAMPPHTAAFFLTNTYLYGY